MSIQRPRQLLILPAADKTNCSIKSFKGLCLCSVLVLPVYIYIPLSLTLLLLLGHCVIIVSVVLVSVRCLCTPGLFLRACHWFLFHVCSCLACVSVRDPVMD